MSVVQARFETVEEIYGLVWTAVRHRKPIEATYQRRPRLFCPHRLGRNADGQLRVVCYQYGGENQSGLQPVGSSANWRCVELEKLSKVKLLEGAWRTAPNHSRPGLCVTQSDIDVKDYPEPVPQKWTMRKLPDQELAKRDSQCRDRMWIMTLRADSAIHGGGSPAPVRR